MSADSVERAELTQLDAQLAWDGVFGDPEWMFKTGMGGMLSAAALVLFAASLMTYPVAIAISAVLAGYVLRVARTRVADANAKLPDWNDWMDLLMSGLSWMAVQFVFFWAVPVSFVGLMSLGRMSGWLDLASPYFLPFAVFSILDMVLLSLLIHMTLAYLMMNFAVQENMAAGWQPMKVFMQIAKAPKTFLMAWLLGLGIQIAMVLVPIITVVGLFFLPTTLFVGQIINATLLAQAWASVSQPVSAQTSSSATD
ncbi:MAG: DUF4013 domain-containing protein [Candidatus Obscuribacterales bacterium]|nr:DUF4013 domain-containing protein [Candidatus Obscuribacterales bacterium]